VLLIKEEMIHLLAIEEIYSRITVKNLNLQT